MGPFRLSKWYLDYVTDLGNVTIAYAGTVQWGRVKLNYSSILESHGTRIKERHSLRSQQPPETTESGIRWRSKALNFDAAWDPVSAAMSKTIYESTDGSVEWNCLVPLGQATSKKQSGLGYVEHLTMTISPWRLPIRTLRWGRFTSASAYITWIDWEGDFRQRIVYMNGKMISCKTIDDDRLEEEDGMCLQMDRSLVLRDGPLSATAFSVVPGIRRMFPARLLQITECKWRSRARLERKGVPPVDGWAIHEKVSWE